MSPRMASASAEAASPRKARLPAQGSFCEASTIHPPPLSVPTPRGPIMYVNIGSSSETACGYRAAAARHAALAAWSDGFRA